MTNQEGYLPFPKGFETKCIKLAISSHNLETKAFIPPIMTATAYKQELPEGRVKCVPNTLGYPGRSILENLLAVLNRGKYGLCFSSGLAALSGVLRLLNKDDHILCNNEISAATYKLFSCMVNKLGLKITYFNFCNLECVQRQITPETKLIWAQSPSIPTMKVTDICRLGHIAKDNKILFGVDNSMLTPYLQEPLRLGANIVMQSLDGYMNGHSDVTMGSLTMNSKKLYCKLRSLQNDLGMVPSPFDCSQVIRGLKTLGPRIQLHQKNAVHIAEYLEHNEQVHCVCHTGLPSHHQHECFKRQTCGNSGTFSFYLKGGFDEVQKFVKGLKRFIITDKIGGFKSSIEIPALMSYEFLSNEQDSAMKIKNNLVQMSVGLENVHDLIDDLEYAFGQMKLRDACE